MKFLLWVLHGRSVHKNGVFCGQGAGNYVRIHKKGLFCGWGSGYDGAEGVTTWKGGPE